MKVTSRKAETVTTHTVALQLDADASERFTAPYRSGAFAPDRLRLQWTRVDEKEWILTTCSISGPMVKKDGTPGLQRSGRSFTDYRGSLVNGTAEWIYQLVEENQP